MKVRRLACRLSLRAGQTVFLWACLLAPVAAEIYKWQDASGRWQFSDQKPKQPGATVVEGLGTSTRAESEPLDGLPVTDLAKKLEDTFRPQTDIEAVTLAVVGIETALGQGSGFFVSHDGLIVTNKHVIRPDTTQDSQAIRQALEQEAEQLKAFKRQLDAERERLKQFARDLEAFREQIEHGDDYYITPGQRLQEQEYREYLQQYQRRLQDLKQAESNYRERLSDHEKRRSEFNFNASLAGASRLFKITLKDNSEHTAELVDMAEDLDLALLRLKGFRTPALSLGDSRGVRQGNAVFAVGSPLGMRDSLTSGIIARLQEDYLITDAQILPGNSGGPLLDSEARVIGVNTLKFAREATASGFGMAIRVEDLRQSFPAYLMP